MGDGIRKRRRASHAIKHEKGDGVAFPSRRRRPSLARREETRSVRAVARARHHRHEARDVYMIGVVLQVRLRAVPEVGRPHLRQHAAVAPLGVEGGPPHVG